MTQVAAWQMCSRKEILAGRTQGTLKYDIGLKQGSNDRSSVMNKGFHWERQDKGDKFTNIKLRHLWATRVATSRRQLEIQIPSEFSNSAKATGTPWSWATIEDKGAGKFTITCVWISQATITNRQMNIQVWTEDGNLELARVQGSSWGQRCTGRRSPRETVNQEMT